MIAVLRNRVGQHVLFWIFYFVLFYFYNRDPEPVKVSVIVTIVSTPYLVFFTYLQLYFLIPRFLLKKKLILYIFLSLVFAKIAIDISLVTYAFIVNPLRTGLPPVPNWQRLWGWSSNQIYPFFSMLAFCAMAVCVKLLKKWYVEKDRNQRIEKEKAVMELEMLKAQVHPHFLFNTLNNLYSLILSHSDNAALVVTHLSELLRYMLYECKGKEIALSKELDMLRRYVELEKLRYGSRLDISFTGDVENNECMIAPLLLLPFVENSFKHGVSEQLDQCWISISIHIDGNNFTFRLSNSINKERAPVVVGGIGLENIKKRLELLYRGNYSLNISEEEEMHIVKLQMKLTDIQHSISPEFINLPIIKPVQAL